MDVTFAGHCPICESDVSFVLKEGQPYRSLTCSQCGTTSRNRALWRALTTTYPKWRKLAVHESSPGWDRVSRRLAEECAHYTASQFDPSLPLGHLVTETKLPCGKYYVENLESQTFGDEVFDLVISQDVFEHILNPLDAIREIRRTLKPGGATIMSVPVVRGFAPSRLRAKQVNDEIVHLLPPEYHGSPSSAEGSLVTVDWGFDIAARLSEASGLYFVMQTFENMDLGIRDECNQILVGFKSAPPPLYPDSFKTRKN
jgi:SAM-dependent methyltransferase